MSANTAPVVEQAFTQNVHHEPYQFISPTRAELSAQGKNVIVTGGGTGIGKAIAIAFAQAGANSVSLIGRREEVLASAREEILAAGVAQGHQPQVLIAKADLSDEAQTLGAFSTISSQVGAIHIVASNAGSLPPIKPVVELEAAEVVAGLGTNVLSSLHTLKAAKSVAVSEGPVLIHISSKMHCFPNYGPKMSLYGAAKAAALALTECFADENPAFHVVNVHPGLVNTDMSGAGEDSPALAGQFCVWLASSEARFLRNKFVSVNWDAEELLQREDEVTKPFALRSTYSR